MPLGASITFGVGSSDGNGYRSALYGLITKGGNPVTLVGSQHAGQMTDNQNEGWPGFEIDQVFSKARANVSVPKYLPNVFFINVGTNDAVRNASVAKAGDRMERLLTYLYATVPNTTVILSSLIPNRSNKTNANVLLINQQYRNVAAKLQAQSKRLVYVDMHGPSGPQVADLGPDGTHPRDAGYVKMANLWYRALQVASQKNYLFKAPDIKS